jgi:hypothetical protein
MSAAGEGLTEPHLYFLSHRERKCKSSPISSTFPTSPIGLALILRFVLQIDRIDSCIVHKQQKVAVKTGYVTYSHIAYETSLFH